MARLLSPLHSVKRHMTRRRQLRTALHMLSASGVIRPSHIEFRYTSPILRKDTLHKQRESPVEFLSQIPSRPAPWQEHIHKKLARIAQWVVTIRPRILEIGS
jgi:hypothetical protein